MNSKTLMSAAALVLAIGVALYNWKYGSTDSEPTPVTSSASESVPAAPALKSADAPAPQPKASAPATAKTNAPANTASTVGFGSTRAFDEHYEKHGAEFGSISQAEYLALAQKLRDAPVGGAILEAVRDDGVISRFDKKSGAFLAFNKNKTIRTFFKPNDGVRYFERQIDKDH